jgi:predicted RNA-binding Zn-ribbon protein involved in translation (DUF1610 family)
MNHDSHQMEKVFGTAKQQGGAWYYDFTCPECGHTISARDDKGRFLGNWVLACNGDGVKRLTLKEWRELKRPVEHYELHCDNSRVITIDRSLVDPPGHIRVTSPTAQFSKNSRKDRSVLFMPSGAVPRRGTRQPGAGDATVPSPGREFRGM